MKKKYVYSANQMRAISFVASNSMAQS